jgi:hypothetical protein
MSSPILLAQAARETGRLWTPEELALDQIKRCISGDLDPGQPGNVAWPIPRLDVETPEQHGRCHHCA